jgi:hypothetical protein
MLKHAQQRLSLGRLFDDFASSAKKTNMLI